MKTPLLKHKTLRTRFFTKYKNDQKNYSHVANIQANVCTKFEHGTPNHVDSEYRLVLPRSLNTLERTSFVFNVQPRSRHSLLFAVRLRL